VRNGRRMEYPLITAGDDLFTVSQFLRPGRTEYSAADVVDLLMTGCDAPQVADQSKEVCFA
jgi:hypothetical protein